MQWERRVRKNIHFAFIGIITTYLNTDVMRSIFLKLFVFVGILSLSACMGQHNQAPSKGANLDSEYVYGNKGGEPRQLPTKYPEDDGTVADRIIDIRAKLYPETQTVGNPTAPADAAAADTTANAGN